MNQVLTLLTTAMLGGLHVLEPGHGKVFIAAYLLSHELRIKALIQLILALLVSHFTLLALIAAVLHFFVNGLESVEYLGHLLDWVPLLIIVYGLYLLWHASTHHHHTENRSNGKHPVIVGLISGFLPCPSVLAPILIAGLDSSFSETVVVIGAYLFGMICIISMLIGGLYLARDRASYFLEKVNKFVKPELLSAIVIILVGIVYFMVGRLH